MENLESFIVDLALILVTAGVVTILFKKIKQPVVLGYIVAGFLISPNFELLPTVTDGTNITTWADIGIIFLMFGLGLEFSFHKIAEVGKGAIITATVVIGAMIGVGYLAGQGFGWSSMDSIFLGCMISMSSTMIILKAYEEIGLKKEHFAQLTLGALVIEDIAGIFMMIILTAISVGQNVSGFETAKKLGFMLLILVVILCVGIYVIPTLLKKVSAQMTDEIKMIASLGFCFLMVIISVWVGFSEALGAFLAGSILAGTTEGEHIEELVNPLKNLFGAVFFVSVGMLIEPDKLIEYIVPILVISVLVVAGQMLFSCIGALASGQPLSTAVRIGFSMVQVGEFSFILASLGTSLGVTGDFLYPVIVCVSVITTFTTPVFIKAGGRAYGFIYAKLPTRVQDFFNQYTSDKPADEAVDSDWAAYLKKYFVKLLIGAALLTAVYFIGTGYVDPFFDDLFENALAADLVTLFVMLVVMAPTISMMCRKKSILFNKLWLKNRMNAIPLVALRAVAVGISTVFVVLAVKGLFINLPTVVSALIAVAVVAFSVFSGFVRGRSARLQERFLANFNQKILSNARKASGGTPVWVDEKLYEAHFVLTDVSKHRTVRDIMNKNVYSVSIINIRRASNEFVGLPGAETELMEGDKIYVLGTRESVDAYMLYISRCSFAEIRNPEVRTLKDYLRQQPMHNVPLEYRLTYVALPVTKKNGLARKTLEESEFGRQYGGRVIGIERELLPILDPKSDFMLLEGDIMWAIGSQAMSDALVAGGLLEAKQK